MCDSVVEKERVYYGVDGYDENGEDGVVVGGGQDTKIMDGVRENEGHPATEVGGNNRGDFPLETVVATSDEIVCFTLFVGAHPACFDENS